MYCSDCALADAIIKFIAAVRLENLYSDYRDAHRVQSLNSIKHRVQSRSYQLSEVN